MVFRVAYFEDANHKFSLRFKELIICIFKLYTLDFMHYNLDLIKDIANLSLTVVLTIATVLLAIYTYQLVDETRKVRKEQVRPNISLYFEHAEADPTLMFIVVANNGQGTAYNVKFNIRKDINDYGDGDGSGKLSSIGIFKHGMKTCPSGFIKKYYLLETVNEYEAKIKEEVQVTVAYEDSFKQKIKEDFTLAIKELSQWSTISPSDKHIGRIAENLKEILKVLKARK